MKYIRLVFIIGLLLVTLNACNKPQKKSANTVVEIQLSDTKILADGTAVGSDSDKCVYAANNIIYYESGKDFTYGEGTEEDSHSPEAASAHTVVHITKPGTYRISGTLSKGQIAVDLGSEASSDPEAVVTLILDNANISCQVAPAIIFYNVFECGTTENPTKDVDTTAAGANVIVADGSENVIRGSYVARIYQPETVVLNEDKTQVEDAKKLHKYDGAFYSKMTMNISCEEDNTGVLNIYAENEGVDSEMHLTLNGGNINIYSGNDGINTNEDGVSVTTINGGVLNIRVTGETGEGDGIDSNGWLVINGGTVIAEACSDSTDAGIDSDMGIHINGGTVIASGHMLDQIEDGGQTYAVFSFAQPQQGTNPLLLKNETGDAQLEFSPENTYSVLIYSCADLAEGTYTLWSGEQQLASKAGGGMGGMMFPGQADQHPQRPEGEQPFDKTDRPQGQMPPEGQKPMQGDTPPDRTDGPNFGNRDPIGNMEEAHTQQSNFQLSVGGNLFSGIAVLKS